MIIVTGATGALNGATVDRLLRTLPPGELTVVARDVSRARRFADRGVAVRRGDFADPDSLPAAFDGADQLLLVSSSDPTADAVALHRAAIDAAVRAGVGRILYTSHQGAGPDSPFGPARDHAATERLLEQSGLPWTSLRNGFYAHTLGWLAGRWQQTGAVTVPADGPVSWTAREDEAEAAAVIIAAHATGERRFDGPITLTAEAAPTFADIAGIASELTGRTIERVVVDPERWLADQIASGQPEAAARFTLGMYQAAERGDFAGTDPLLGILLGRRPRTVSEELADELADELAAAAPAAHG